MARRVGLTTVISRFPPQEGFAPPPSTPTTSLVPDFTDGEQTSINKVKESEARYGEKTKQQQPSPKTMKTKKKKMLKPKTVEDLLPIGRRWRLFEQENHAVESDEKCTVCQTTACQSIR